MSGSPAPKLGVLIATLLVAFFVAPQIEAQARRSSGVTSVRLRDNPYRNAGGSCVYDRMGKLVHSPEGANCEGDDEAAPPAAAEHEHSESDLYDRRPLTKAQVEVQALLRHHSHIARELRQLRESIAKEKRKSSIERLDKITDELAMHLAREEKLLNRVK